MVLMHLLIFLQIILETFPVSSSGNVALFFKLVFLLFHFNKNSIFPSGLVFWLHGATLVVTGLYFFKPWWQALRAIVRLESQYLKIALFCSVADLVTIVWYVMLKQTAIEQFPLWLGFLITGCFLYSLQWIQKEENQKVTMRKGFVIGMVQGIAFFPGISRFGITYAAGRWLGFSREKAFEYSFLVAFPLLCAGFVKGWWQLHQSGALFNLLTIPIFFSICVASVISYLTLSWVGKLIKRGVIWKCAWYVWFLFLVSSCLNLWTR